VNAADLARYTSGILRARADYYARPTRACHRPDCDELAEGMLCADHVASNTVRAQANRAKRAAA
jgi:hypothetical protein